MIVKTICTQCGDWFHYEVVVAENDRLCPRCLWQAFQKHGDLREELNDLHDLLGDSEEENHKLELEIKDLELDRKRVEEENDVLRSTTTQSWERDTEVVRLTELLRERKHGK